MNATTIALGVVAVAGLYVFAWSLCASAKEADKATAEISRQLAERRALDEEARAYEQAESMGRDLPPAA